MVSHIPCPTESYRSTDDRARIIGHPAPRQNKIPLLLPVRYYFIRKEWKSIIQQYMRSISVFFIFPHFISPETCNMALLGYLFSMLQKNVVVPIILFIFIPTTKDIIIQFPLNIILFSCIKSWHNKLRGKNRK